MGQQTPSRAGEHAAPGARRAKVLAALARAGLVIALGLCAVYLVRVLIADPQRGMWDLAFGVLMVVVCGWFAWWDARKARRRH